jgi:hypothetical protein
VALDALPEKLMPRFTPCYGPVERQLRNIHDYLVRLGVDAGRPAGSAPVTVIASGETAADSLADLDDVAADSPASGDALVYNGTDWANGTIALAGDVTGTNAAAVVAKANGKTLPTPGATDDTKELAYDHAGSQYVLRRHKEKVVSKTATYTATLDDTVILVDATGGAVTINLPAAATATDHVYTVKKVDASANAVTLDGNGAETIDGAATQALGAQWARYRIACSGAAWFIIGS